MTEKEKMLSGQTYYARDPELIKLHKDCRKSLKELNLITSDNVNRRFSILENLLGKIDDGVWIESPFYCDYGTCLLYTSPSPRDRSLSRMPSSA